MLPTLLLAGLTLTTVADGAPVLDVRVADVDAHEGTDSIVITRHDDGLPLFAFSSSTLREIWRPE